MIEVLVTVVILSLGVVAILEAFQTSLFALGSARDTLRATLLLKSTLPEVELQSLQGLPPSATLSGETMREGFYRGFRRECNREVEIPAAERGRVVLYRVSVTVAKENSRVRERVSTRLACAAESR